MGNTGVSEAEGAGGIQRTCRTDGENNEMVGKIICS